jgi:acetyltransferase-like isoleucine patch superfamily enzyme
MQPQAFDIVDQGDAWVRAGLFMSVVFATETTELDVRSEPAGPLAVYGLRNTIRIGRNVRLAASVVIRGDGTLLEIGDDCDIDGHIHVVRGGGRIRIGPRTTMTGVAISLHEPGDITIGADCMFSNDIHMDVSDVHPIYDRRTGARLNPPKPIVIGDRVWLGTRALVLKGARIGDGAIIGAGAMVTGEIPQDCIAGGAPAKVLREQVEWKRDFDQPPTPRPKARPRTRLWPFGDGMQGFLASTRTPFDGPASDAAGGTAQALADRMGRRPDEFAPPASRGLPPLNGETPHYLDNAGQAFDPLNQPHGVTPYGEPIDFRGFAVDGPAGEPAAAVDVVVDGAPYPAHYGLPRDDVAQHFGNEKLSHTGFAMTLTPGSLEVGRHRVSLRVVSADRRGFFAGPEMIFEVV